MAMDQFVPWEEGCEELVFPCHTSIISQELLLDKLESEGGVDCSAVRKVLRDKARGIAEEVEPKPSKSQIIQNRK